MTKHTWSVAVIAFFCSFWLFAAGIPQTQIPKADVGKPYGWQVALVGIATILIVAYAGYVIGRND